MAIADITTNEDLGEELERITTQVAADEYLLIQADSVLCSIVDGSLLDAVPPEDGDRARHNAAVQLLCDLLDRFRKREDRPGTDPSISLHVLTDDVKIGRLVVERRSSKTGARNEHA